MWNRYRHCLESGDIALIRQIRPLIDLPEPAATLRLESALRSMDAEDMQKLWAMLMSIVQSAQRKFSSLEHRDDQKAGSGADTDARHNFTALQLLSRCETGIALADRVNRRLRELGYDASSQSPVSQSKLERYEAVINRLAGIKVNSRALTGESRDAYERIIDDFEQLLQVEPVDYLAADIKYMIALALDIKYGMVFLWEGIGDEPNPTLDEIDKAKQHYMRAAAMWDELGRMNAARACRLKAIDIIRRFAADFDQAIKDLSAILDQFPRGKVSVGRAEIRMELAQTYASIGDAFALSEQLKAIDDELAVLKYSAPHPEDPERSLVEWIAQADDACSYSEDFEAELASLVALHAAVFSLRGKMMKDQKRAADYRRAASTFSSLEQEMTEQAKAVLIAERRERAEFFAEFGDRGTLSDRQPSEADKYCAALERLDRALDALRTEIGRRKNVGLPMDDLLSMAHRIQTEARRFDFLAVAAIGLLVEADIHLAAKRYEEVIKAARAAFNLPCDAMRDLTTGVWALDRIVDANTGLHDDTAISAVCGEAIDLIERHRYDINAPYSQSAYLQDRSRYYTLGIESAYRIDDYDTLLQRADLSKAGASMHEIDRFSGGFEDQHLRSQFKTVSQEIEHYRATGKKQATDSLAAKRRMLWDLLSIERARTRGRLDSPALTARTLATALDEDEAAIYYYWLCPTVLLIAAFDRKRIVITKNQVSEKARREIEDFAAFVQSLRGVHTYLDRITYFSALLIPDRIKPVLVGKRRLLLSPHRLLHALPLHALMLDNDYLIRRFAVSYVPNLGCLLRSFQPAPTQRVLAIGIRDFEVPGEKIAPLEDSETEVAAVVRAYEDRGIAVKTLRSEAATVGEVRRLEDDRTLRDFTCIHLATHGADVLGDNPMEAHLWLRDAPVDGLEIANWRLQAELVVLSACHSGQRTIGFRGMTELAGDEIFGLQAAFFAAGAARVVGALWPVESAAARQLMSAFHSSCAAGTPPELALQAAMVEYLDSATRQTRKVYYWAPFCIVAAARPGSRNCRLIVHRRDITMAELALHFEFTKNTDIDRATDAVRERLSALQGVEGIDAVREQPRLTGLEIAAAIAVTVQIVRGTRRLLEEIRRLVPEMKSLISEINGLQSITVEVGSKRVAIAEVNEDEMRQIADDQSEG
jgi:tetratricopeptide (TPR) repeat protein